MIWCDRQGLLVARSHEQLSYLLPACITPLFHAIPVLQDQRGGKQGRGQEQWRAPRREAGAKKRRQRQIEVEERDEEGSELVQGIGSEDVAQEGWPEIDAGDELVPVEDSSTQQHPGGEMQDGASKRRRLEVRGAGGGRGRGRGRGQKQAL